MIIPGNATQPFWPIPQYTNPSLHVLLKRFKFKCLYILFYLVCEKVNASYVDGMLPAVPRSDDLIPNSNIIPSDTTSSIDTLRTGVPGFWTSSQEKPEVEVILNDGSVQREVLWISIPEGTNVLKYRVYVKDALGDGYNPKGVWHIN